MEHHLEEEDSWNFLSENVSRAIGFQKSKDVNCEKVGGKRDSWRKKSPGALQKFQDMQEEIILKINSRVTFIFTFKI